MLHLCKIEGGFDGRQQTLPLTTIENLRGVELSALRKSQTQPVSVFVKFSDTIPTPTHPQ